MPDLILIRGLPGSGKSTLAKKLKTHQHFETDMWFERGGIYRFDPSMLGNAQAQCLRRADQMLSEDRSVVVSNWFITNAELEPYFELGRRLNIPIRVVEVNGNYQNIHGIPRRTIDAMRDRWEPLKNKEVLLNADVLR